MRMKSRRGLLWVAGATLLVTGAALGWRWSQRGGQAAEEEFSPYVVGSEPGDARSIVCARGILKCADTWPAVAGIRGRLTELVPQGTAVKKGDVLFRIDDTTAREEIENNETSLQTAELSLVRLDAEYQLTDFRQTQNVLLSDARLKHAELEERLELEEPDARERRLMDIAEELARLDVEDAQDEYERESRMLAKGYIAASGLESYEQKLANAKATLAEQQLQNRLKRKGATAERRVELRMNVQRAANRKEVAEARKARRIADIVARQDAERKSRERLLYLQRHNEEELAKATVTAPMDGVFMVETYRDWSTGGALKEIAVGDEKWAFDLIGSVIDPAQMEVSLVVHETDFHRLRAGLPVEVTLPAVPDKVFRGTLKRLGAIGRDRNHVDPTGILGGDSEISMFNAVIALESEGMRFHPGMSALVTIIVSDGADRLLIPRAAVSRQPDGSFAARLPGGQPRTLTGRYHNEMYFQVEAGLERGETIEISRRRGAAL